MLFWAFMFFLDVNAILMLFWAFKFVLGVNAILGIRVILIWLIVINEIEVHVLSLLESGNVLYCQLSNFILLLLATYGPNIFVVIHQT